VVAAGCGRQSAQPIQTVFSGGTSVWGNGAKLSAPLLLYCVACGGANPCSVTAHRVAVQEGKGKQRMQAFTDKLSCACFGLANTVTIMFYTVENATKVRRPPSCVQALARTTWSLQTQYQTKAPGVPPTVSLPLCSWDWCRVPPPQPAQQALAPLSGGRMWWMQGLVEGGLLERPVWLQFAVHAGNSATAWGDLLLAEQRSFSPSAQRMALALALAYGAWLLLVRRMFGKFPYPVLNKLPFPWGFLGFFAAGIAVILSTFHLGKWVRHQMAAPASRRKSKAA
jgi:hypothetical protein